MTSNVPAPGGKPAVSHVPAHPPKDGAPTPAEPQYSSAKGCLVLVLFTVLVIGCALGFVLIFGESSG